MGKIINPKGSGSLVNIKGGGNVFNTKPIMGVMKGQTEDDVIVRLYSGQSVGPGWFMYVTYPETIELFP